MSSNSDSNSLSPSAKLIAKQMEDARKKMYKERVEEIKEQKLNKLRNIDEKDLYNVIEENSPFKK